MKLSGKTLRDIFAEEAAKEAARVNEEARAYLAATDWYIVREAETGRHVPQEVLDKRAAARATVKE